MGRDNTERDNDCETRNIKKKTCDILLVKQNPHPDPL